MPRPTTDPIRTLLLALVAAVVSFSAGCGRETAAPPQSGAPAAAAAAVEPGRDAVAVPPATEPIAPQSVARPLASPRNDVPGAPNLAQISPALWRGAQPTAEGFRNLKALGIRTVVNLRNVSSDRDALKGLGLRHLHIHFATWHAEDEDVVKFLKVLSDPDNHPVFVHCQHGADRTGTMAAVYRVYVQGWTMPEAMQELPRFGFHSIWANLKRYLDRFDAEAIRKQVEAAPTPKVEVVP